MPQLRSRIFCFTFNVSFALRLLLQEYGELNDTKTNRGSHYASGRADCDRVGGVWRESAWRRLRQTCKCPSGQLLRINSDDYTGCMSDPDFSNTSQVFDPSAIEEDGCTCMWFDRFPPAEQRVFDLPVIAIPPAQQHVFDIPVIANVVEPAGCSDQDMSYIVQAGAGNDDDDDGSFPWIMKKCARKAYSFFGNSFDREEFNGCVKKRGLPVSAACAQCLTAPVEYGCKVCKSDCFMSSCDPSCIECVANAKEETELCTGHAMPELVCAG